MVLGWCGECILNQEEIREIEEKEGKTPRTYPGGSSGKEPTRQGRRRRTSGLVSGEEDLREEEKAARSSILVWKTAGTGEPGWLQSMDLQRVGSN